MSNYPAGVTDNDPHFTDESGDVCKHSAPICAACEEEDHQATQASLTALAEMARRNIEMERLGITEEDIEETRYPTHWPENR